MTKPTGKTARWYRGRRVCDGGSEFSDFPNVTAELAPARIWSAKSSGRGAPINRTTPSINEGLRGAILYSNGERRPARQRTS